MTEDPISSIQRFLEEECWFSRDGHDGNYMIKDDVIHLDLPIDGARPYWNLFTRVYHSDDLCIGGFEVQRESEDRMARIRGVVEKRNKTSLIGTNKDDKNDSRKLEEYIQAARKYHKYPDGELTPEKCVNECANINKTIKEGLRYEFGLSFSLVAGVVFDPIESVGQGHLFISIPSKHLQDRNQGVFLDGAALQFADRMEFPQTLGPAAEIDQLHTIGQRDHHRPYYSRTTTGIDVQNATNN